MDREILLANLQSIKGTYQCDEIAQAFGETHLYQEGGKLRGRCPIHNGESPSFFCYPDEQGRFVRWQCFRCNDGGDVLDLYAAIHGPFSSVWHTILDFADRYRLKLWRAEDFMSDNQLRFKKLREEKEKRATKAWMDICYLQSFLPYIRQIEDPKEREYVNERVIRHLGLA